MCVNIPACIKVNNRPPVEPAGLPLHSDRVAVPLASSGPEACPLSRKKRPTAVLGLGRHQQSKRIEYPEFRHLVPRHLSCLPLSDIAPDNTTGAPLFHQKPAGSRASVPDCLRLGLPKPGKPHPAVRQTNSSRSEALFSGYGLFHPGIFPTGIPLHPIWYKVPGIHSSLQAAKPAGRPSQQQIFF